MNAAPLDVSLLFYSRTNQELSSFALLSSSPFVSPPHPLYNLIPIVCCLKQQAIQEEEQVSRFNFENPLHPLRSCKGSPASTSRVRTAITGFCVSLFSAALFRVLRSVCKVDRQKERGHPPNSEQPGFIKKSSAQHGLEHGESFAAT